MRSARRRHKPLPGRQAEEEAAKKAAEDAEAKRQADEALAKAEAERQRAEADARAKAEAETAARRQASEEDQRKAEAEAATRRQADEAQAEREKAEADKAAAAATKLKEEAETAEKALRLEQADRQRLQVALTSLGFDTRGNDGVFGPRSREMIAGWQKKAGAPPTGFLTAAQRDQLLRMAAPAVTRWDDEQKKLDEEKKKADTANTVPVFPSPAPAGAVSTTQPSASAAPAEAARPTRPPDATRLTATAPIRASISLVPNSDNISSCRFGDLGSILEARIYSDKIEMQMPWGWEALKIDGDSSFSGRVSGLPTFGIGNTFTTPKFSIQGNVRSKDVHFKSLSYYGCTWKGTIT